MTALCAASHNANNRAAALLAALEAVDVSAPSPEQRAAIPAAWRAWRAAADAATVAATAAAAEYYGA